MTEEQQKIKSWLIKNNFREPTKKDFPTYVEAHKKKIKFGPYWEDVHYAWKYNIYR